MKNLQGDDQLRLYEQIVANMASGVYIIKVSDGKIVFANPKFEKLFAYEHNELLGMHVSELNAPTDITPEETALEISEILKKTGEWHGLVNNIKKDGTPFWCRADVSTFNHSTYGEVFIAIHTDVSDRVLTRKKLKDTQLLLKSSIESPKDLIIISIDNEYRYLYFNDTHKATMKSAYGIDVKIGMNILDCIGEESDRKLAKACYDKALSGDSYSKIDEYGNTSNKLYYETDYNPIYDDNKEIIGATAFAKEITDRKRFEIELKESEERFKKLSELTSEGIIIHKGGICTDVNKAFEDIFGYNKDELIGQNLIERIITEEFHEIVYRNMQEDRFERYEILAKRKDGVLIDVQIGGRREIIHKGEKVFVSTIRDITENRKNELKVKKSEADLVSQIENTRDSIWSVDKNYKITITNSNFFRDFNIAFNHELRLGDKVLDYLPEPLKPVWKDRYDKALLGEHFVIIDKYDFENLPQYVEFSFNPVIVDGKIEGVACFTKDITEQKIAEKALKDSEEKFRKLSDLSPASISIQRTDKFLYVNKAFEILTGYTKEELLSLSPLQVVHPEITDEIRKLSDSRLKGEDATSRYDLKIRTKSNQAKWIDVSFSVIDYENQKASMGVSFDITELKNAKEALMISESKLKVANSTKNKFFSIIAHDLRSPFSSILGLSNILSSAYHKLTDEERKECISELSLTSKRGLLLLENLLNWARAQQGGIEIKKVSLDLKGFIDRAIEPYMANAHHKKIKVKSHVSNKLSVLADEQTIMTVLGNLFNNAVKYTPNKGSIDINVQEKNSDILIAISDSGVGMTQSMISKLFLLDESFSTPGTNNEKGTGLGLILCKEFVELNGGSLSVESEVGKGSTFSFVLPG